MKSGHIVYLLPAIFGSAQAGSGVLQPGPEDSSASWSFYDAAGRHPNATSFLTFARNFNNTPETWSWRVNITEVAEPNNSEDVGEPSANYTDGFHRVNTQWQLNWPGNEDTFQGFLSSRNLSAQFTTLSYSTYPNITQAYKDIDNGKCDAILGKDCTQSVQDAAQDIRPNGTMSLSDLRGCESTLDVQGIGYGGGTAFGVNPGTNVSGTARLYRNGTLFFTASPPYKGGNISEFQAAQSALQFLVMSFVDDAGSGLSDNSGATVLCRVVELRASAHSEASTWRNPMAVMWSSVFLSTLVALW